MIPQARTRRGLMLVLSAPSGAGKSTLARMILDGDDNLSLSVSVTTRSPRENEADGVQYHFVSRQEFESLQSRDAFLEWACVHGNLYGTLRTSVEEALCRGQDLLFDVDWQGAQQLRAVAPDDIVSIFLLPPSLAELRRRLQTRAQDTNDVIEGRMQRAREEVNHWREYDYSIINDDIQACFRKVQAILMSARLQRERVPIVNFIVTLLAGG